jgi:predicted nucleic acid-binding protein
MRRVFLDTNIFIYLFERCGEDTLRAIALAEAMKRRRDEVVTSALTIGEILVKPLRLGETAAVARFEAAFHSPGLTIVPFERACSRRFAEIRAHSGVKPPDAIQLACAATYGCTLLVTNDNRLSKTIVPGIDFIVSLEQAVAII